MHMMMHNGGRVKQSPVARHEVALVLKNFFPKKQSAVLLTSDGGKRSYVCSENVLHRLCPGMVVVFSPQYPRGKKVPRIDVVDIVRSIDLNEHGAFVWAHRLIELVYHFTAFNDPVPDVFIVLHWFLAAGDQCDDGMCKHPYFRVLSAATLLSMLGFHPRHHVQKVLQEFETTVFASVDFPNYRPVQSLCRVLGSLTDEDARCVESWVSFCVQSHPDVRLFRTHAMLETLIET